MDKALINLPSNFSRYKICQILADIAGLPIDHISPNSENDPNSSGMSHPSPQTFLAKAEGGALEKSKWRDHTIVTSRHKSSRTLGSRLRRYHLGIGGMLRLLRSSWRLLRDLTIWQAATLACFQALMQSCIYIIRKVGTFA